MELPAFNHPVALTGGHMYVLRIDTPSPSFDGWKKAFERDPVGREKSGVRR
jgi:hypothetical protein